MLCRPPPWAVRVAVIALVTSALLAPADAAAKKKKNKAKKKKQRALLVEGSDPCIACRRTLGHLEASLADSFNKLDRQIMQETRSSEFNPIKGQMEKQMRLARIEIVEDAVSKSCASTGIMRPELGTACQRILEDHSDEFESALVNHEKFGGRAGLAKHLCGATTAGVCPAETDWSNKGIRVIPAQGSPEFRSEPVPRSEDQPGFTDGIFALVGHNVAAAVAEDGKDVFIHFRRAGSEFDRAYHKAWHEFGASLKDSTISETLLLAEIDLEQNDIPAGTPVGGEYIENPCIALFPADRKHSPIYIQLHTDPDFAVKSTGGEWFLPWLQQHGKRETRWEVDSLVEARQAAEAKARGGAEEQQPVKAKKAKKEKKKKKAKKSNKKFAVTIGDEKKVKKWGSAKRPTDYDRESVLTQELVCSACYVVIDEIEYRLRKLKNVAPVIGRRLDSVGRGINKRLNPGRNEVNVADALEHACELTEQYSVSGTGKGQRWVRYNAREAGESILIESATIEAESPKKLTTACSWFIEENEDELWEWLLAADPDGTIQDEFCMTYMDECDGAIFDETKKPSKLYMDKDDVPDVLGMGDSPMPGHGPKAKKGSPVKPPVEPQISVDGKPAKLVNGKPVPTGPRADNGDTAARREEVGEWNDEL